MAALRSTNRRFLHAVFAKKLGELERELYEEHRDWNLLFYEGWRSPVRQTDLYARGRMVGKKGQTVTRSQAWESFHQYGLAADFVASVNGVWTWWPSSDPRWTKFHEMARFVGLEPISIEKPHVQLGGVKLSDLRNGFYPPHGGQSWEDFLTSEILQWGPEARKDRYGLEQPGAPPPPDERPPLEEIEMTG